MSVVCVWPTNATLTPTPLTKNQWRGFFASWADGRSTDGFHIFALVMVLR